jgi:hypothetical protein
MDPVPQCGRSEVLGEAAIGALLLAEGSAAAGVTQRRAVSKVTSVSPAADP